MRKILILIVVLTVVISVLGLCAVWAEEISLENQFIPTVVNGITTCTSLTLGFSTTFMIFGFSNRILDLKKDTIWAISILMIVVFSIGSLNNSFHELSLSEYHKAFRYATTGLTTAILILFQSLFLIINALDREGRLG